MDKLSCQIPDLYRGWRLDAALADIYPDYSRSALTQWIKDSRVVLDGQHPKPRSKLVGGEWLELEPVATEQVDCEPQPVPLDIAYEDEHLLVINKAAGQVMHPAAGNHDGTIQNGLLHHEPSLVAIPRAGIVHRLDKDTTGLFVVAKTLAAHTSLVAQLQEHTVSREYRAVVQGKLVAGGTVDEPIGRHPRDRKRMAVVRDGKDSVTHYRVLEKFNAHTYLVLQLETGRTHQIRVHMAHLYHALVGDSVYAGRLKIPSGVSDALADELRRFPRQALHAIRLRLTHPGSGEEVEWSVPLADDIERLLVQLRANETQR